MKEKGEYRVALKAVVFKEDGTILAMRRSKTAPSRPLGWDLPGGQLEYGEEALDCIKRETKEEAGLHIEDAVPFHVVARFDDNQEYWITICYSAQATAEEVTLSYEHDMYRWVRPEEFAEMTTSPRQKEFAVEFTKLHSLHAI